MIIPPYLKPGDKIYITAPARKVSREELEPGISLLKAEGYEVVESKHLYSRHMQFSGTDQQRAADMQIGLNDPSIKAILAARGGYGTIQIVDRLDFSTFLQHPKWICGFSDVTVLHSHINKLGVATIHGPLVVNLHHHKEAAFYINPECIAHFIKLMTGKSDIPGFESSPLNRDGVASGPLTGGNLSVLYSLSGSKSDFNTDGKILFLEDLDEYLYHLDRMMQWLRRSGKLDKLAGLVVGDMSDMKNLNESNPYGFQAYELIQDVVKDYGFPVAFNFPAGHGRENYALIMGAGVTLNVSNQQASLSYQVV